MRGRPPPLSRAPLRAALVLGPLGVAAAFACSASGPPSAPPLALAPNVVGPEDLLHQIATFKLQVYASSTDGGTPITCNTGTGVVTGVILETPTLATSESVQTNTTTPTPCPGGAIRCFEAVKVPQSSTPDVFVVTGYASASSTTPIAQGCATETPTTATLAFSITLIPVLPKEVCGDGILQPPETCDPGGTPSTVDGGLTCFNSDSVCCTSTTAPCQTTEELLSFGNGGAGSNTLPGGPNDKSNPSFVWPSGGTFLAAFTDNTPTAFPNPQVSVKILSTSLTPVSGLGDIVQNDSVFLPNSPLTFPPNGAANPLKSPAVTEQGGNIFVAFSDTVVGSINNAFAIHLRSMDSATFTAQQPSPCPISDAAGGGTGSQTLAAIAPSGVAGSTTLLVAWQDDSGNILARTYTPNASGTCAAPGPQQQLSTGSANSNVSVAGTSSGWMATWQSGTHVFLRPLDSGGVPTNSPLPLEATGHSGQTPTIASITSGASAGAFAVTWSDTSSGALPTIVAQRFQPGSGNSVKVIDSTPTTVSQAMGTGEITPFIASSPAVNGSYIVAWVDQGGTAQVWGRLLQGTSGALTDATGYLTNAIDGTTSPFQVSSSGSHPRVSPTVAVGGTGPTMAFGWVDNGTSAPGPGVIARRFPLPTK